MDLQSRCMSIESKNEKEKIKKEIKKIKNDRIRN